ncbi:MAG: cadmium-translocating P-type ATPase [Clostridia bacterium]|nr:cadmium-translocating P-type ATPase [Clostridia bacterium]
MAEKKKHYKTVAEEHCHCHEHSEHEEHCHCHEHNEQEERCHCHDHDHDHEDGCGCGHDHDAPTGVKGRWILRYALGAIPVILGFLPILPTPLRIIASAVGYLLFGFAVWRDMLRGFGKKRIFTEFTLMCVASLGAFLIGEYADGAAVMYLYSLGETLSSSTYAKSKRNLSELLEITPESATVLVDGRAERMAPDRVTVGQTILVVAGERIPLDGVVRSGGGSADSSSVTGESKPLELYEGVACPSGAILNEGSVELTVTATYENSVVAKLAAAVTEATARKSAAEKKITRFARVFTPLAFGVAIGIVLLGWGLTGDFLTWLHAGLTVLVVSCPCSLVLSVPLTYFAGIGTGASSGIIFRGGETMDSLCRLSAIAFDKTGTLTESGLGFDGAELYGEMGEEDFLSLSYAVLTHSPHAAAVSFCQAYEGELRHTVTDVEILGGRGVVCRVDGKPAFFGNGALMRERGIETEDSRTTAIFGAWDGVLLGRLRFSSHLKKESAEAVSALRKSGVGRIAVLSGDGEESVATACREAGIEEYYAALTPARKTEIFDRICYEEKEKKKGSTVAYCGDGLNDSAVIAGADVGIAMGGCGSALTVSSADVVLMDDNPKKIATAVRLSRRTSRIAGENIVLSLGIKIAVLTVGVLLSAITGEGIPMGLAIVADVGAAILAVLNALRAAKK